MNSARYDPYKSRADWFAIAERVMRREFAGADSSTRESLLIGLRVFSDGDMKFRQAILKLEEMVDAAPVKPAKKREQSGLF